jgi:hypothetical protein
LRTLPPARRKLSVRSRTASSPRSSARPAPAHRQSAVAGEIDVEEARRHQLADHRAPLGRLEVGADGEGRQPVVPRAHDLVGGFSHQAVDDMAGAEALAGAHHRGQHLLAQFRAVDHRRRLQAHVAIAARAVCSPK